MTRYEEARAKTDKQTIQQIKICSKKKDWNSTKNNKEELSI